jgi:CHAT domain-containing protein/Tfp pilus assembly protein PilF
MALCQPVERALSPSSSVTKTLAGTADLVFTLAMPANQTLELQLIEQRGDAGLFSILAADGTELATLDPDPRTTCVKRILIPPGAARIVVRPLTHTSADRVFEIRTGPLQAAGDPQRLRISAERLLSEAEKISRENGDPHAAVAGYEKSRVIWAQLADRSHQAYALLEIGEKEEFLGETKSALAHTGQALDLWTAAGDSSCMADALRQMADLERATGQKGKAEEHVAQALAISRSLSDARDSARALLIQGDLLEKGGEADRARANYSEALTLAHEAGRPLLEAGALQFLAVLEFNHGGYKESIEYGERTLAIATEEGDREMAARSLNSLASTYAHMGEHRKAIGYFDRAIPVFRELSNFFFYGNALYNEATSYLALDDYAKALEIYAEVLPIFRKADSLVGQGYTLMALGNTYRRLGDGERADSYFRQASVVWQKTGNKQGEMFALSASADVAFRRRQFSKALELYQQSLAISHAAGFQRQEAIALADLSEVYLSSKDPRAALDPAAQSLAIARKTGDKQEEAAALYQQGRAWRALREFGPAREALEQSLAVVESLASAVRETNTQYELAALDRDAGELPAARDRIRASLDSLERAGVNVGSTESRMLFAAAHRRSFELAVEIEMLLHQHAKAFEQSERARARTLVDLIRGARLDIRAGVDPELLDRERRIQEVLDAKQDHLMRTPGTPRLEAQARKEIDDLVQQYRDIDGEIRRKSPQYAALIEPRVLALSDVQTQLPDAETALLEFWLGEEHSYAWLVTKSDCRGFELPRRSEIEALARRAYEALNSRNVTQEASAVSAADREFERLSQELSQRLLGPLPGLSGFRRLWIVSDGALEYLPFTALPVPGTKTPLVAAHQIVRLSSASVLAEMRNEIAGRPPAPLSVAVFADPVFRADDERVANVSSRQAADAPRAAEDVDLSNLPRLYFSRKEADAITALGRGGKSREVLDFDASRSEVKKQALRDYRVVHFATHALVDSRNPELSGLVLSMIDREGRPQDGFLRLHEVYNLKLNADLVVLSACRTALGAEVRSEGMIGLTRGFMYAGAPQVLASLWSIRDNATTWFMTRFYEALLERHQTPEAALREAQLAMRKDPRWSQPYYWAAFTIQGAR